MLMSDTSTVRSSSSNSNASDQVVDEVLLSLYRLNRSVRQPWYTCCVILYSLLIGMAFAGNSLVLYVVIRSRELRKSARHVLIGTLAASDLLLCVTMPLTAIDALTKYWPFNSDAEILCKTVRCSSMVAVCMSSMAIITIAADRHHCIVHSTRRQLSPRQAAMLMPFFCLVAILLACPMFYHTILHVVMLKPPLNDTVDEEWSSLTFCIEDWRFSHDHVDQDPRRRLYYSVCVIALQLLAPLITISVIYSRVFCYLRRYRMVRAEKPSDKEKARRTNVMLAAISIIFCFSWLPLHLVGVVLDAKPDLFGNDMEAMTLTFVVCHLIGMTSACSNPLVYGYLNETFRKEFIDTTQRLGRTLSKYFGCFHSCHRRMAPVLTKTHSEEKQKGEQQPKFELNLIEATHVAQGASSNKDEQEHTQIAHGGLMTAARRPSDTMSLSTMYNTTRADPTSMTRCSTPSPPTASTPPGRMLLGTHTVDTPPTIHEVVGHASSVSSENMDTLNVGLEASLVKLAAQRYQEEN